MAVALALAWWLFGSAEDQYLTAAAQGAQEDLVQTECLGAEAAPPTLLATMEKVPGLRPPAIAWHHCKEIGVYEKQGDAKDSPWLL